MGVGTMPPETSPANVRSEHVCLRHDTRAELVTAVSPYLRDGLLRGERCVHLAAHGVDAALTEALPTDGGGELVILGAAETYLRGGRFDPERMSDWVAEQADRALAAGFSGFRLVGETASVTGPGAERLSEYESELNDRIAGRPIRVMCAYDHTQSAAVFREALSTHPDVQIGGIVCPNPHYLPPDEHLGREAEVDGILSRLALAEDLRIRARELSRQLHQRGEAERRALARELHDELGQLLAVVLLGLPDGEAESRALIGEALESVRTVALELRPSVLDDLGLAAALRSYVRRRGRRDPFVFDLAIGEVDGVSGEVATTCFRMIQEAITNVARHAAATRVTVRVEPEGDQLVVNVRDDGRGFDPATRVDGLGLLGMAERVALVDGALSITSTVGLGTEICATLPLRGSLR